MATINLEASVTAGNVSEIDEISATVSGISEATTLTSDIAAAQAIGVGNASAEIDALDASWVAYQAAADTNQKTATGLVRIQFDTAQITTLGQLRNVVDQIIKVAEGQGVLTR